MQSLLNFILVSVILVHQVMLAVNLNIKLILLYYIILYVYFILVNIYFISSNRFFLILVLVLTITTLVSDDNIFILR